MWPIFGLLLLVGGAALAKKRKEEREADEGPLAELPAPGQTESEAVEAAQDALEQAQQGAAEGTQQGAAQAAGALETAAQAAQQSAGTGVAAVVADLAKQVEALAKASAQKTGAPPPPTKTPELDEISQTSPGQPVGPLSSRTQPAPVPTAPEEIEVETDDDVSTPIQDAAEDLEEAAAAAGVPEEVTQAVKDAAASLPIPVKLPTSKADEPPLAQVETSPIADPNGTIKLARDMLAREQLSGWRGALSGPVESWQRRVGITADGKFGPGSALKMGSEVGILPRIRFWPKSSPSKSAALTKYRNDLFTLAANLIAQGKKEHGEAVKTSAEAEDARAFGNPNPAPVSNSERLQQLQALTERIQ